MKFYVYLEASKFHIGARHAGTPYGLRVALLNDSKHSGYSRANGIVERSEGNVAA